MTSGPLHPQRPAGGDRAGARASRCSTRCASAAAIVSIKDGCQPQGQCGCCLALIDGRPLVTCAFEAGAGRGPRGADPRGCRAPRARDRLEGARRGRRRPVRLLHPRDRAPRQAPARPEAGPEPRGDRPGDRRPPLPLHRLRADRRGGRADGEGLARRRAADAGRRRRRREAARPLRRPRPGPRRAALRGRHAARGPAARRARPLRRTRGPGSCASTRRRPRRFPGCAPWSRRRTCPASAGTASCTTTGRASWPRARRCAASATSSPRWRPTTRARRARRRRWSRSSTSRCRPSSIPRPALAPGAPQVNPKHPNLLSRSVIRRGDAAAALAASAHVVTGTWHTQRIEHLFLEPEAALAEPLPDGRLGALHARARASSTTAGRSRASSACRRSSVHVELVPSGGAFGGKEDMSVQAQTALLARVTGRPVKLVLTREESVRLHPKRHPIRLDYTVGCDAEGRLTAVVARLVGDSGAYASVGGKVLERAAGHACGPYRVRRGRRRGARRLHEQPALRRHARLRRPAGGLRHRGLPRPAREEGRPRRLGDPQPQRGGRRRRRHHRPGAREVGRPPQDARRGEGRLLRRAPRREGGRDRLRPQEQRHRQRRRRVGQVPARRRDGRDASRSTTATPRWARAC